MISLCHLTVISVYPPPDGFNSPVSMGTPVNTSHKLRKQPARRLDAIQVAGIKLLCYRVSPCRWGWVAFVRAEKADVVPLLERMVRIKPRYLGEKQG